MAREQHDREDLLRDASGLAERIELALPDVSAEIFCGFRGGDAFSLYWGQDSVFQFNAQGELRRAYWRNKLVAAYQRQLYWLRRKEDSDRMSMSRLSLSAAEAEELLDFVAMCLTSLHNQIQNGDAVTLGTHPPIADVRSRVATWLAEHLPPIPLAVHPAVGRR